MERSLWTNRFENVAYYVYVKTILIYMHIKNFEQSSSKETQLNLV